MLLYYLLDGMFMHGVTIAIQSVCSVRQEVFKYYPLPGEADSGS